MPIPKTIAKRQIDLYNSGRLKHQKKPDVDNFIKLYLDCIDGICFEGDQRVSLGDCIKLYHPDPKTIIIIDEMSEIIDPVEVECPTWFYLFGEESDKQSSFEKLFLHDSCSPHHLTNPQFSDMNILESEGLALSLSFPALREVEQESPAFEQFLLPLE